MYYLQSRYYNPEWGRFINADSLGGRIGELLSHNIFAYCENNPIKYYDPNGTVNLEALGDCGGFEEEISSDPFDPETEVTSDVETLEEEANSKELLRESKIESRTPKGEADAENYYKKGLKEIPDNWIEVEAPEELKIKSESFKELLREQGYNPKGWRKVVEKWASPDGNIYQRNYWTNGTESYYHGEGIEEFFPH